MWQNSDFSMSLDRALHLSIFEPFISISEKFKRPNCLTNPKFESCHQASSTSASHSGFHTTWSTVFDYVLLAEKRGVCRTNCAFGLVKGREVPGGSEVTNHGREDQGPDWRLEKACNSGEASRGKGQIKGPFGPAELLQLNTKIGCQIFIGKAAGKKSSVHQKCSQR